jgi:hypothetical protein
MTDTEVMRLRRLRNSALRIRAVSRAMSFGKSRDDLFSRTAIACWGIARIISGELQAHPYLRFQSGPPAHKAFVDRALAALRLLIAPQGRAGLTAHAHDLQRLCRELDDTIALTWSPSLNDTLGRARTRLRRSFADVDAQGAPSVAMGAPVVVCVAGHERANASGVNSWPYLAI